MPEGEQNVPGEDPARRRRINRMKKSLLTFLFAGVAISLLMCVYLCVQLSKINNKLDALDNSTAQSQSGTGDSGKNNKLTLSASSLFSIPVAEKQTKPKEDSRKNKTEEQAETSTDKNKSSGEQKTEEARRVYLTFDDGPSENTDKILDILARYNVKATFFVNGRTGKEAVARYRRIVKEGHTLGMHSYTHEMEDIYSSLDKFQADTDHLGNYLYKVTGIMPKYYRFPGGTSNTISKVPMEKFIKYIRARGIQYYDWNVSSYDAVSNSQSVNNIIKGIEKDVDRFHTSIILMHDSSTKKTTVEALPKVIERLKEKGVEILPIDENTIPVQHIKEEEIK